MNYSASEIVQMILEAFGVIAIVAAGIKAVAYLASPYSKTKKKLEEHEKMIEAHKEFLENDKRKLDDLTVLVSDSLKLQLSLVNHAIDGNGIETMKEIRKEIHDKLL